jgi:predicted small lipoprotein YifL
MLRTIQILISVIAIAICALNMTGCGQTGALYLPAPNAAKLTNATGSPGN